MSQGKHSWRGCVTVHRGILHAKVKNGEGRWVERSLQLRDTPENRVEAQRLLDELRERSARTVRAWSRKWLAQLRRSGLEDLEDDQRQLDQHVLPVVGELLLDEVRPRHLLEIVEAMKRGGVVKADVRSVYQLVEAIFVDAQIAGVLPLGSSPAILTRRHLKAIGQR